MTRSRTPPAWRRAFLRELSRTGSVAGAAQACGICKTTPYQLRKSNPAFAASWERALAAAREALPQSATLALAGGAGGVAGFGAGSEDIGQQSAASPETPASAGERGVGAPRNRPTLRPAESVRSSRTGKVCIMRTGPGRWSAAREAVFLAELTASANVKAAARAAGVSTVTVYNRRKLWPAFKAQWEAAVAEGFARIETLIVCAATTTLDPEPLPVRAYEAAEMSMDQAIKIWLAHSAREHGDRKRRFGGPPRREPSIEEVRAEILRKVAAIERADAMGLAKR